MTTWQDVTNSTFLLLGAALNWANVLRILQDKKVLGVSPWPVTLFTLWGVWDCYFFPHLDQRLSMVASALVVIPNSVWLFLYWWYSERRLRHS